MTKETYQEVGRFMFNDDFSMFNSNEVLYDTRFRLPAKKYTKSGYLSSQAGIGKVMLAYTLIVVTLGRGKRLVGSRVSLLPQGDF